MKNWLRRKLLNFLNQEEYEDNNPICLEVDDSIDWPDPLHFKLQKANGGHILEVKNYDHNRDKRYTSIHLIADNENLQESIAKIITYESLKK